jgi:hypothetical protein
VPNKWWLPLSNDWYRAPTELVQHNAFRGSSRQHKGSTIHNNEKVWLYHSPIPRGRKGPFTCSFYFYLPLRRVMEGEVTVNTLWCVRKYALHRGLFYMQIRTVHNVRKHYCAPHCKDKIPKFWNIYSQKRNIGSQSQFLHSCVCEWFIYSHDRSAYSVGGNM